MSRYRILSLWIRGSFWILHAKGLIARLKIEQDKGSPCLTSQVTLKHELKTPLITTTDSAF